MQPAILAHDEMVIGAGEQDITGDGLVALDNERHSPVCLLGEPLSQARGKCRIDMLDDDNRGLRVLRGDEREPRPRRWDHLSRPPGQPGARATSRYEELVHTKSTRSADCRSTVAAAPPAFQSTCR